MRSLLLLSILLVCAGSARQQFDRSTSGARPQAITPVEAVDGAAATVGDRVQAVAYATAIKRLDDMEKVLPALLDWQQDVQQTLSGLSNRLDSMTEGLTTLSDQQQNVRQIIGALSARQDVQTGLVLGEPCRGDQDCGGLKTDTVCGSQGRCVCGEGLQEVAGGVCRPYPRLSEPCRLDSHCQGSTEHSVCEDNVCVCSVGFVNDNSTECRRPLLAEPCVAPGDCQVLTEHSVCSERVCTCAHGFHNNSGVCLPSPHLHEACNATSECEGTTEHAVCSNNVCTCPAGFWGWSDSEIDTLTYGSPPGCRHDVPYGQRCDFHRDCSMPPYKRICYSGVCSCDFKYFQLHNETKTRIAFVRLHGNSECQTGNVEIKYLGDEWLYMCDNSWTVADATVLCRTLGFSHGFPLSAIGAQFPREYWAWQQFNFDCSGSEATVTDCKWSKSVDCEGLEPVAVKCHYSE